MQMPCQLLTDLIKDPQWLEETFIDVVQKRGAAIIQARGASSGLAANAALDTMRKIAQGSKSRFQLLSIPMGSMARLWYVCFNALRQSESNRNADYRLAA